MEEVLIEPYITIKLDAQHTSVVSDWTGSPTTEQFKDGKNKVLGVLAEKGMSIIVLNYRNMTAYLNLETQVWTINDWFPRVLKEDNIKQVGVVIPDKVVAQIVIKAIFAGAQAKLSEQGIEVVYFDNYIQLENWLDGKDSEISTVTSAAPSTTGGSSFQRSTSNTPSTGGVDLGGAYGTTNYDALDDIIHDDPFA